MVRYNDKRREFIMSYNFTIEQIILATNESEETILEIKKLIS